LVRGGYSIRPGRLNFGLIPDMPSNKKRLPDPANSIKSDPIDSNQVSNVDFPLSENPRLDNAFQQLGNKQPNHYDIVQRDVHGSRGFQ
jgi:hypothetical protein